MSSSWHNPTIRWQFMTFAGIQQYCMRWVTINLVRVHRTDETIGNLVVVLFVYAPLPWVLHIAAITLTEVDLAKIVAFFLAWLLPFCDFYVKCSNSTIITICSVHCIFYPGLVCRHVFVRQKHIVYWFLIMVIFSKSRYERQRNACGKKLGYCLGFWFPFVWLHSLSEGWLDVKTFDFQAIFIFVFHSL